MPLRTCESESPDVAAAKMAASHQCSFGVETDTCRLKDYVDSLRKKNARLSSNWPASEDLLAVKENIDLLDRLVSDNLRYFWSIRDSQPSARPFGNALIHLQTRTFKLSKLVGMPFQSRESAVSELTAICSNVACAIAAVLEALVQDTFILAACAPVFDFDESRPGNGYRSLLQVFHSCVLTLTQTLDSCLKWRNHVLVWSTDRWDEFARRQHLLGRRTLTIVDVPHT
jgi:hypothetical protein